ncbi:MAG: ABC transporter substrate-binding protein [Candidatus Pelethousia sp.]|nr:ABC transporter substrate-binding protein [Candidatus Pelethousia sp.]
MKMKRFVSLLFCCLLLLPLLSGCTQDARTEAHGLGNGWQAEVSLKLQYAQHFSVDYYEGGYKLITLSGGGRFLVVPQGAQDPAGIDGDITVLHQPIRNIYLVATSAMCLFDALDALDTISLSGTRATHWYNANARAAMEAGSIRYAGKYSEPDYELILTDGCELAIESTMIDHTPEVKEKLEGLGIPVLVDQSSHESHPLGRTEWLKLYAALLNKEDEAQRLFDRQVGYLNEAATQQSLGKTVAFFHISTAGYAVARKSGDYVSKMIELAGGDYIFKGLGDPDTATSTVTLEMEKFYATAKNADFIIYNSTIGGELSSLEALIAKSELLKDFKAVQNGNVWCTGQNLFQETTQLGQMILDINRMITNEDPQLNKLEFLYKLQ